MKVLASPVSEQRLQNVLHVLRCLDLLAVCRLKSLHLRGATEPPGAQLVAETKWSMLLVAACHALQLQLQNWQLRGFCGYVLCISTRSGRSGSGDAGGSSSGSGRVVVVVVVVVVAVVAVVVVVVGGVGGWG